ncbi:hypothetical protein Pla175_48940 [Pirellulimonas nuda]|uniref:Immunoglobulin G-binding protein A n=1 Tax=Pirellulimonas nuda TaxID=2528009 RepID=A0A518DJ09_9BACT|nr:hypothetical protein [Pirellulimonas nuda]QDU91465.1 hypothetical protein Pla175_48940 [Pirellulimonas nuda]
MPTAPASPPPSVDQYIDQQIERTRRAVRLVDLATALMQLALAAVAFFLIAALLEHWLVGRGGFSGPVRFGLFLGALAAMGWFVWRAIWPIASRSINPIYAADVIEKHAPSLKNSLVNLLFFRGARDRYAPAVYETLERHTAAGLGQAHVETAVDRGHIVRLGYLLLGAVVLAGLYTVLSPKSALTTVARVMAPWAQIAAPSRVRIERLEPGSVEVTQGETITVAADVTGLGQDETAYLVYSTGDGQVVDRRTPMSPSEAGLRYALRLPLQGEPEALLGLQNDLTYRIEAGDAETLTQRVRVIRSPAIAVREVRYDYPDYTGFIDRTEPGAGDLVAIEGTRVTIVADANVPIDRASIDFEADGVSDLTLQADGESAQGSFVLRLRDDRRTPEHSAYALRLIDRDGRKNPRPARRRIDVTPDLTPEVDLLTPKEAEIETPLNQAVELEVNALDPDFALGSLRLMATRVGDAGGSGEFFDLSLLEAPRSGPVKAKHRFAPTDHGLRAGDVLECWAVAADNREPTPNTAVSRRVRIKIVDPGPRNPGDGEQIAKNDPQQQGGGEPGAEGADGEEQGDRQPNDAAGQGGGGGSERPQPDGSDTGAEDRHENAAPPEPGAEGGQREAGGERQQDPSQQDQQQGDQESGAQKEQEGQQDQQQEGDENQQGSDAAGMQKAGEENDGPSGGQGGQPGSGENSKAGEQQGEQQAGGGAGGDPGGEQRPVSAEGDDDATAFQKIQNRLSEQQEKEAQGAGQPSDPQRSGEPSQGDPTGDQPPGAGAGERTQRAAQGQQAQGDERQVDANESPEVSQKGDEPNSDAAAEGSGAATPPEAPNGGEPRPPQGSDQAPSESAGGEQLNPKGEPGAGDEGEPQGAPGADSRMRPRDKPSGEGADREKTDSAEPPAPGNGQKESDSQGGQGGDRAGGGEEGGGQQANREGTGSAGQNQAADEGGGRAADRGPGDASQNPGGDQASKDPTGSQAKTNQDGGQSQAGGDKPGGSEPPSQGEPGEGADGAQSKPAPGDAEGSEPAESPTSGDGPPSDQQPSGGEPADDRSGDPSQQQGDSGQGDQQQPGQQKPAQQQQQPKPGDPNQNAAGAQPGGNADRGGTDGAPPPGVESVGDEANLEYARKQTDLVLEKLADQLRKNKVDQQMLDELGWSQEDLRRFVERWQSRREEAAKPGAETAQQRLDEALKALGIKPPKLTGDTVRVEDDMRDLNEGVRNDIPAAFRDRVRVYNQGVSKTPAP